MKRFFLYVILLPTAFIGEKYEIDIASYIQNGKSYHYELTTSKVNTWDLSKDGILSNHELLEPGKDELEIYFCSDITCGFELFGVNIAERIRQRNP